MVYITADYDLALAVIVFCDRHCQTAHVATAWRIKAVRPLHDVPAKVFAFLHQIDFLKLVLPYIRDEKAPGAAVKRKAPGVGKTISPDLRQTTSAHIRIVGWNRILQTTIHVVYIDPQHLTEQRLLTLPVAQRIATTAAVTQSDVKKTIRAKGELSPFVIRKRLINCKQNSLTGRIGLIRICRWPILSDYSLNLAAGQTVIVQIEARILAVVRMECQS